MRVRLALLLVAIGGATSVCVAEAAAPDCRASDRSCMRVSVPIDRSGVVPGTVALRVERQAARNAARPPLFLIAGGPGQSATRVFRSWAVDELVGTEARSRDIVVMDLRGTGRSGALDCRSLQRGVDFSPSAACAARLGPRRDFYSSRDMADDIDAVRQRLGVEQIALYGVSYGTHVALTYARRHPGRVERLVLNSVVGPDGIDAFESSSMRAAPRVVATLCGKRRCRSFTRDAAADVVRLARRLEHRPMAGLVTDRRGRRHRATVDAHDLLDVVVAGDANPLLRAEVPGAVRDALQGDRARLLRLKGRAATADGRPPSPRVQSAAAYVATLCADVALPWTPATPLVDRDAASAAFVTAQPAGAFAPFGRRTALASDVLEACRRWPSSPRPPQPLGALPDVPALLVAGGLDTRTPVENARAVAAELPRAKLMPVRNAGHGVFGLFDSSRCVGKAVRRFLAGGDPGRCGAGRMFLVVPPLPRALSELSPVSGVRGRAGRTVHAIRHTVLDGLWALGGALMESSTAEGTGETPFRRGVFTRGALRGGTYALDLNPFSYRFERAAVVEGVRVSGALRITRKGMLGVLRVSGPAAARGRLVVRRGTFRGTLGGRPVRARFRLGASVRDSARSSTSSQPARLARRLAQLR